MNTSKRIPLFVSILLSLGLVACGVEPAELDASAEALEAALEKGDADDDAAPSEEYPEERDYYPWFVQGEEATTASDGPGVEYDFHPNSLGGSEPGSDEETDERDYYPWSHDDDGDASGSDEEIDERDYYPWSHDDDGDASGSDEEIDERDYYPW